MFRRVEKRSRYYVDPVVQSALIRESIWYWVWGTAAFAGVVFAYRVIPNSLSGKGDELPQLWYHLGPLVFASIALFPIVVLRAIRFTHRFVGPMVRFRNTLKMLAEGHLVQEIQLRDGDFWTDVAADINRVARRFKEADERAEHADPPAAQALDKEEEPELCAAAHDA